MNLGRNHLYATSMIIIDQISDNVPYRRGNNDMFDALPVTGLIAHTFDINIIVLGCMMFVRACDS